MLTMYTYALSIYVWYIYTYVYIWYIYTYLYVYMKWDVCAYECIS